MTPDGALRVLHFGKFSSRSFGGIETHVRGLTEGLATAGLDVTNLVYDLGRQSGGVIESAVRGVRIVSVPCTRTLASLAVAPAAPGAVRHLSSVAPFDIAHAHFPDPLAFACMPLARGAARIASWHSDIVRQKAMGRVYGVVARRLFDPLDAVTGATPSHLDSAQLRSFGPRLRRVVPYGVDLARFASTPQIVEAAERLQRSVDRRPIVFALGRHVYYKGFDVLVDAMRSVDAVLLLGGQGPLTAALAERAQRIGARGNVRFVGRIEEADLAAYYHACAVYCLPSLAPSEAFGLVQVEAMACAKPIVNCDLGNAVNFVAPHDVCAWTVAPNDAPALADALRHLLADAPLRDRLGREGRRRAEQHFSMQAMVDGTLALYRDVLA